MKKLGMITSLLLIVVAAQGRSYSFEHATKAEELPELSHLKGDVCIVENDGNRILRLTSPKSFMALKSGATSKELFMSVDWFRQKGGAGTVLQLTDASRKEKFLNIIADHAKLRASSFRGKKMKMRTLFETEPNTWYRFEVDVVGKYYSLKITKRGADNSNDDAEVVYNSVEKRKRLRINTTIEPACIVFNQWVKKTGFSFDYDNLVFTPK